MSTPQTTEIAGVVFNRSLAMDGQALTLNGAGLRSLLMVKVYVAALYVPQPSRRAEDILAAGGPLAIERVLPLSSPLGQFSNKPIAGGCLFGYCFRYCSQ